MKLERTSINIIVEAVMDQLEDDAKKRGVELVNQIADEIVITADQSLMAQLMINLVSNAIKYGVENGHVWVKARYEKDSCVITVADDGIGIKADELPHIFERFYRADLARDRSGSGLGLSIVKWIVDEHGGQISVDSEFGHGTVMEISLPNPSN